jgi:hypothetical protein
VLEYVPIASEGRQACDKQTLVFKGFDMTSSERLVLQGMWTRRCRSPFAAESMIRYHVGDETEYFLCVRKLWWWS